MEVKDLREDKKDQVKTEKGYRKGKGITEKVLFDDSFDWESFDEKAEGKVAPNEKLAELDLMEVDFEEITPKQKPLFEKAEDGLDSFGLLRDTQQPAKQTPDEPHALPPKPKTLKWLAAGALFVVLPCIFLAAWILVSASNREGKAVRTDQVTREINHSVQELLPLQPFLVPVLRNNVKAFQWVSPTLVVHSYGSNVIKEQIVAIRGEIYNVLKEPEQLGSGPLNSHKLARLIQGRINGYLGMNLVERVQIVIKDPIITDSKRASSDYS